MEAMDAEMAWIDAQREAMGIQIAQVAVQMTEIDVFISPP
jgi:hypothetical protein